jgi:hypothetical protein
MSRKTGQKGIPSEAVLGVGEIEPLSLRERGRGTGLAENQAKSPTLTGVSRSSPEGETETKKPAFAGSFGINDAAWLNPSP